MYVKFFGAASETDDGVSSADDAKAAEGTDGDYETEDENIRAKGRTKAARSDDDDGFQAERRTSRAKGGTKAARSDDDDFQAERSVRPGRGSKATRLDRGGND